MGEALSNIDDKELYDLIEKANLADKLINNPDWKLLREAGDRIVERAVAEFALNAKVSPKMEDLARLLELKITIKKYKFGLVNEVKMLKKESEFVYEEARERGIFGNFFDSIKEKAGL